MNRSKKFTSFLESLRNNDNSQLISAVHEAFTFLQECGEMPLEETVDSPVAELPEDGETKKPILTRKFKGVDLDEDDDMSDIQAKQKKWQAKDNRQAAKSNW